MKTYKLILATALTAIGMVACKNSDQSFPDYDYRTVYFAYQYPVRTITLGEDTETDNTLDNQHKCKIMATTGGGYSNPNNIVVRFTVDNTMVDNLYFQGTGQKIYAMPETYYTLSSDQMEIASGSDRGGVEVQLTDAFFNDTHALENCYVIPIRMTHVEGADSILRGEANVDSPNRYIASDWNIVPKDYTLYCIKYINEWHASYLRRGVDEIVGNSGYEALTQTSVRHEQYVENDEVIALTTCAYRAVKISLNAKDLNGENIPYTAILTFDAENNCTVTSAEPDDYTISGSGKFVEDGDKNSWGNEDRNVIYLDYTVDLPQLTCHTLDTLVVRNRGVIFETFTPEIQ